MNFIDKILSHFGYCKKSEIVHKELNFPQESSVVESKQAIILPKLNIGSLELSSVDMSVLPKNYSVIPMDKSQKENAYNALSVGLGGTSTAVQGKIISGLYRATADPATLMKLSSGGLGSAVVNNGKIVGQAGFSAAGAAAAAPIVIFQTLSIVTGQYYLNVIKKEIKQLNSRIEKLIQMQESSNRGKLDSAYFFICQLERQNAYSFDDLVILRHVILEIQSLYFNYIEQLKIIAQKQSLDAMLKEGKFTSNANLIKKSIEEFHSQDFGYLVQMASNCYQVYSLAEVVYFKILAMTNDSTGANIPKIEFLLSEFNSDSTPEHVAILSEVKDKVLLYIKDKANNASIKKDKAKNQEASLSNEFDSVKSNIESDTKALKELKKRVIEPFKEQRVIYYDLTVPGEAQAYICNE